MDKSLPKLPAEDQIPEDDKVAKTEILDKDDDEKILA